MNACYVRVTVIAAALGVLLAACGGGSSASTSPTPTPTTPGISACGAISDTTSSSPFIVNGSDCTGANSPVVLVNLRDADNAPSGQCSGTVIAPRAVLTAAHCLINGTTFVRIFLGGSSPEQGADSFKAYPGYRENDPNSLDVGVVLFSADIGRTPVPALLSRDARVGETAVIAGWGKDQNQVAVTLRAGTATITAVDSTLLHTQFTTSPSSVCQGDSGGPLLLQEAGVWALAGIISANQTTACTFGENFYANVRNSQISSFILSNVPNAATR